MNWHFFTECALHRPELFKAVLAFNAKSFCPQTPKKLFQGAGALAQALWQDKNFRLAARPDPSLGGWWDFEQESYRFALLGQETLMDLCRHFSAAALGEKIARVIARDEQLQLRARMGENLYHYAMVRGRYQVGQAGAYLSEKFRDMDLPSQFDTLVSTALLLVSGDWPDELVKTLGLSLPQRGNAAAPPRKEKKAKAPAVLSMAPGTERMAHDFHEAVPALPQNVRRAFYFTLKKLLLREVAPQWAPCFD